MLQRLLTLIIPLILIACNLDAKPLFVVSNHPCAAILRELVGAKAEVHCLLKPGSSPHALTLKPSDMFKLTAADAVFYVSENLDPWIKDIETKRKISLIKLLPRDLLLFFEDGHSHDESGMVSHGHSEEESSQKPDEIDYSQVDPHFWTDPMLVKELIPILLDTLSKITPDLAAIYKSNGIVFQGRLLVLNKQIERFIDPHKGKPVFLYHPSFMYFLKRYSLEYAGSLEMSPGREPTAGDIAKAIEIIQSHGIRAIFFEAQFPKKPVKTIKKEIGTSIYLLDPIGGDSDQRKSYTQIMLYNAKKFRSALRKY